MSSLKVRSHGVAVAAFFCFLFWPQQLDYIVTHGVIHTVAAAVLPHRMGSEPILCSSGSGIM